MKYAIPIALMIISFFMIRLTEVLNFWFAMIFVCAGLYLLFKTVPVLIDYFTKK